MALRERLRTFLLGRSVPEPSKGSPGGGVGVAPGSITGGRLSKDAQLLSLVPGLQMLAPLSSDEQWQNAQLDVHTLQKASPRRLIELLADVSPDVSRALWDFLLFMNPGWTLDVYEPVEELDAPPDPTNRKIHAEGKAALNRFMANLHGPFAADKAIPFDMILASIFIGMFMRGSYLAELVLDLGGRMPVDIATPDPYTVVARTALDDIRGVVWEVGQFQFGKWVPFDRPTIFYIPVHPLPGKPYGRALATPAVFSTLFLIGLLHDLRRVVSQQGYPRLDIEIDFEVMKASMPSEVLGDPKRMKVWIDDVNAEVSRYYAQLQPDDAFVHGNGIKLNKPLGVMNSQGLGGLDGLIKAVERQAIRALKTMPLLMGVNESTSETHANRQWEIHVAGIKALQHMAETMFQQMFNIALQVQGIQADVVFRFAELRGAELLRDAQAQALETNILTVQVANGWISNDEAAEKAVGHKAFGPPLLLSTVNVMPNSPQGTHPEPPSAAEQKSRLSEALVRNALGGAVARCENCGMTYIDDIPGAGTIGCPRCPGFTLLRQSSSGDD